MSNRFARMMTVLENLQRTGTPDVDALAGQLGVTPGTVRRYHRELLAAGALRSPPGPAPEPGAAREVLALAANDGATTPPLVLSDDELAALHVGARFLATEGDPELARVAHHLLERLERVGAPELARRRSDLDALYAFQPDQNETQIRLIVNQAITERRVVSLRYRREKDARYVVREVEPLAQFFTDDHWSFLAWCRLRQDLRTFCHARARGVKLTDRHYEPRQGLSLERFIQRRKMQLRPQSQTG